MTWKWLPARFWLMCFIPVKGPGHLNQALLSGGNATTIKFWKCKFDCREILSSLHRLLENLGWNFGVQPIPRVAPRVAPRIGFSHKLGRDCPSENCTENAPEFRELLWEWPFHSESVFFKIGVVSRVLRIGTGALRHLCDKSVRRCAPHKWHTCLPSNHFVCCVKMTADCVIGASFACHKDKKVPPIQVPPMYKCPTKAQKSSRRLELSIWKNTPHRRLGQLSGQRRPKVCGRFAFPGARNPRSLSFSRFGKSFPAFFPWEPLKRPRKQLQPCRVFLKPCLFKAGRCQSCGNLTFQVWSHGASSDDHSAPQNRGL